MHAEISLLSHQKKTTQTSSSQTRSPALVPHSVFCTRRRASDQAYASKTPKYGAKLSEPAAETGNGLQLKEKKDCSQAFHQQPKASLEASFKKKEKEGEIWEREISLTVSNDPIVWKILSRDIWVLVFYPGKLRENAGNYMHLLKRSNRQLLLPSHKVNSFLFCFGQAPASILFF